MDVSFPKYNFQGLPSKISKVFTQVILPLT